MTAPQFIYHAFSHHIKEVLILTLGAVHILRQPPEGVWQMVTIADEGGRGGKPKADHC